MRPRARVVLRRIAGPAFLISGVLFLALACRGMLDGSGGVAWPGPPALAAAGLLSGLGLLAAARAWSTLLRNAAPGGELRRGFIASQVGKYIPGGVWLGAGQIGFAVRAGVPLSRAVGALAAYAIALVAAAGGLAGVAALVAGGLGPAGGGPSPAVVPGLLFPLLLHRRWMTGLARVVARRAGGDPAGAVVPAQSAILRASAWITVALALTTAAFTVVLHSLAPGIPSATVAGAFAVAWLAGYMVPGLPSGIGAREGMLVLLLGAGSGPAVVMAALAQRVAQMGAELILLAATNVRIPIRALAAALPSPVVPRPWLRALPNLLSGLRVLLVPALWSFALADRPVWVGVGLLLAGATDMADGWLARRLDAVSARGAQLDSLGDNLLALSGAAWLLILRPDVAAEFVAPLLVWIALYLTFLSVGWSKFRRFGNLHLWSAKLAAVFQYAFLVHCMLFDGVPVGLFQATFAISLVSLVEGLAYQLLARQVDESTGSVLLALRARAARPAGGRESRSAEPMMERSA